MLVVGDNQYLVCDTSGLLVLRAGVGKDAGATSHPVIYRTQTEFLQKTTGGETFHPFGILEYTVAPQNQSKHLLKFTAIH